MRDEELPQNIILSAFQGIRNNVSEERLAPEEFVTALNVDLDDSGQLRRRRGKTRVSEGNFHSLWRVGTQVYGVRNGSLGIIKEDYSHTPLVDVGPDPVSYTNVGTDVYFASRNVSGKIVQGVALPWGRQDGEHQWVSPVMSPRETLGEISGRPLSAPPLATEIEYYKGRIYLASRRWLWATELYIYDHLDKTKNFIQFEHDITMVRAVEDGLFVGTTHELLFLSGVLSAGMRLTTVMESPVLPGSAVTVPLPKIHPATGSSLIAEGDGPAFMTGAGICLGMDGGQVYNLTESKILFPEATRAAALYREDRGINSYLAVLQSGGTPAANSRVGDYADAELVRAADRPPSSFADPTPNTLASTIIPADLLTAQTSYNVALSEGLGASDVLSAGQLRQAVAEAGLTAQAAAAAQTAQGVSAEVGLSVLGAPAAQALQRAQAEADISLSDISMDVLVPAPTDGNVMPDPGNVGTTDQVFGQMISNALGGEELVLGTTAAATRLVQAVLSAVTAWEANLTGLVVRTAQADAAAAVTESLLAFARLSATHPDPITTQDSAAGALRGLVGASEPIQWGDTVTGDVTSQPTGFTFTNAEAAAYNTALTGTLTDTQKGQLDTLVGALKAGGLWSKIIRLQLYDIPTNSADALLDLKTATVLGSRVNSPAWVASRGFTGDGFSSYISTGAGATALSQDTGDAHFGVWIRNAGPNVGGAYLGVWNQTIRRLQILRSNDSAPLNMSLSANNTITGTTASAEALGMIIAARSGDDSFFYRNKTTEGAGTQKPNIPNSGSMFVGARNNGGNPVGHSAAQISLFSAGGYLTAAERDAYHTALNTWRTARDAE